MVLVHVHDMIKNLNGTLSIEAGFLDDEEKKRLNQLGGRILRGAGIDFEEWKNFDLITKEADNQNEENHKGYADYYLATCWNDLEMINEAEASVYRKLVDIDSKLGMDASLQLTCCLRRTTRWDIIKVWLLALICF